jgi:hypothetical protein
LAGAGFNENGFGGAGRREFLNDGIIGVGEEKGCKRIGKWGE